MWLIQNGKTCTLFFYHKGNECVFYNIPKSTREAGTEVFAVCPASSCVFFSCFLFFLLLNYLHISKPLFKISRANLLWFALFWFSQGLCIVWELMIQVSLVIRNQICKREFIHQVFGTCIHIYRWHSQF